LIGVVWIGVVRIGTGSIGTGSIGTGLIGTLAPLFLLDLDLEPAQAVGPELVEPPAEIRQPLGSGSVVATGSLVSHIHEVGLLEHAQVLGDGRTADREVLCDPADGELLVSNELEYRPAGGFGQGSGGGIHAGSVDD
jgi:hypothetical protein